MLKEIPIMTCFNNNYCAPAGVCFYSLLKNANPDYSYKLFVLSNDISEENKEKLHNSIKVFENASLEFINMNNKFKDLFEKFPSKRRGGVR